MSYWSTTPRKASAIMSMMEQMIETIVWKKVGGLTANSQCRLCKERETVEHLLTGYKMIANSEYLARHNSTSGDGCCLGKRAEGVSSECEMV